MLTTPRRSLGRAVVSLGAAGLVLGASQTGWAQAQPAPPAATPPAAAPAAATPASAKTYLAAGDKAAKAKDWTVALAQYQASMSAQPSPQALDGVAGAQYELKMSGEAYESYDRFLKDYGNAIGNTVKKRAETRMKELSALTGYVSIRVNEMGADVSLDGKAIGQSPVAALIRVAIGGHKVDVTKDGFAPVSKAPTITANGKEIVDIQLVHEATTGHLVVKEKTGQPVRVIVDGSDVGAAPLDIEVAPGAHEVVLRSSTLASPAQKVDVTKGQPTQVELAAVAASAHLDVTTSDRKGIIFFDGKPVAEGAYSADVAVGPHTIAVTRDGYERYEKKVELTDKQVLAETVTLKIPEVKGTGAVSEERTYDGIYGGFGGFGAFEPGGNGNEIETSCTRLGAQSCSTGAPVGGGAMGWVGYAWHPVGVELFMAAQYDQTTPSATFVGGTPLQNPVAVGPPKVEQFLMARLGGLGALRARLSFQSERIRGSLAAGIGLSVKAMAFKRHSMTASSASSPGGEDIYPKDAFSVQGAYVSPAVAVDGSVAVRLNPTMALALGITLLFETAGSDLQSKPAGNEYLAGGNLATPLPIPTPAYHLATGAQTFVGPYLGLQFGP